MTKAELEAIAKRKDEFLQEMAKKYGLATEYITRLLKAKSVVYNQTREGEIDKLIKEVVNRDTEELRAKLKSKILATPREEPCWLSKFEPLLCTGHIVYSEGLPHCSKGGLAHYFAGRLENKKVLPFLENYKAARWQQKAVQEAELKTYKEAIAQPFDLSKYQPKEETQDGFSDLYEHQT
jgi:hypothetical protein